MDLGQQKFLLGTVRLKLFCIVHSLFIIEFPGEKIEYLGHKIKRSIYKTSLCMKFYSIKINSVFLCLRFGNIVILFIILIESSFAYLVFPLIIIIVPQGIYALPNWVRERPSLSWDFNSENRLDFKQVIIIVLLIFFCSIFSSVLCHIQKRIL